MEIFDLGGTYTQQLEAGGTETGSLQVSSNAQVGGDFNVQGGISVASSTDLQGNLDVGGLITLQRATSLVSGQSGITQTLTNGSSTGGTVNGYNQILSVANTGLASTTNGINIALTDNAAPANTNKGINISMNGNNTSQTNRGLYVSVTGSNLISYGVDAENSTDGGLGVRGANNATGAVSKVYYGVVGGAIQTANANYTSYAVSGTASAGTGATAYGGYFGLSPLSTATSGAALYATNSTVSANILQLQDNTTSVLTVSDGGAVLFQNQTNSTTAFQIQNAAGSTTLLNIDTSNSEVELGGKLLPNSAGTIDIGSTTLEFNDIFVGDNNGLTLGLDQDAELAYDETTDDRVELTGAGASLFIEDRLSLGQQIAGVADNGIAFTSATSTLTPVASIVKIQCLDPDGCDITMGEGSAKQGDLVIITNDCQPATFSDTANVSELAGGFMIHENDILMLMYSNSQWVEISRSDNTTNSPTCI